MSEDARNVTAALLIIGDEILSGRTVDANLSYLAKWLNAQGIQLQEARVVPDELEAISDALNALRHAHDYVFTTGGIGPTHDDITVDSVAAAFGVAVEHHPRAVEMLKTYYGDELNERRMRMARTPAGARIIENPMSGAPGIALENVYMLAGIPAVMRAMLEGLAGELKGGREILSRTVGIAAAESAISLELETLQRENPDVMIGSYPLFRGDGPSANIVLRGPDSVRLAQVAGDVIAIFKSLGFRVTDGEIR